MENVVVGLETQSNGGVSCLKPLETWLSLVKLWYGKTLPVTLYGLAEYKLAYVWND